METDIKLNDLPRAEFLDYWETDQWDIDKLSYADVVKDCKAAVAEILRMDEIRELTELPRGWMAAPHADWTAMRDALEQISNNHKCQWGCPGTAQVTLDRLEVPLG